MVFLQNQCKSLKGLFLGSCPNHQLFLSSQSSTLQEQLSSHTLRDLHGGVQFCDLSPPSTSPRHKARDTFSSLAGEWAWVLLSCSEQLFGLKWLKWKRHTFYHLNQLVDAVLTHQTLHPQVLGCQVGVSTKSLKDFLDKFCSKGIYLSGHLLFLHQSSKGQSSWGSKLINVRVNFFLLFLVFFFILWVTRETRSCWVITTRHLVLRGVFQTFLVFRRASYLVLSSQVMSKPICWLGSPASSSWSFAWEKQLWSVFWTAIRGSLKDFHCTHTSHSWSPEEPARSEKLGTANLPTTCCSPSAVLDQSLRLSDFDDSLRCPCSAGLSRLNPSDLRATGGIWSREPVWISTGSVFAQAAMTQGP